MKHSLKHSLLTIALTGALTLSLSALASAPTSGASATDALIATPYVQRAGTAATSAACAPSGMMATAVDGSGTLQCDHGHWAHVGASEVKLRQDGTITTNMDRSARH